MELKAVGLSSMRNSLHYGFHREISVRIAEEGTVKLRLTSVYPEYLQALTELDIVLVKARGSQFTEDLAICDGSRDRMVSAFLKAISAALLHFSDEVVYAAKRITVHMKIYGNISDKPYNEQTTDVDNLVQDLKSDKFKSDVALTRTKDIIDKLEMINEDFKRIMLLRDEEKLLGMTEDTRVARAKVDGIYNKISKTVFLYSDGDGEEDYISFVKKHDIVVDRYKKEMLQSRPRVKKAAEGCEVCG